MYFERESDKDIDYFQDLVCLPISANHLTSKHLLNKIRKKAETTLAMKARHGTFIGPGAPFDYQRAESNHDKLITDPKATIVVRKIFELAANGTGVTAIVRYLNEKDIPTPIQYARSKRVAGNYDDSNETWNSRSVKYIPTNRTYTGIPSLTNKKICRPNQLPF